MTAETTRVHLPGAEEIRAFLRPLDFFDRYACGSGEGETYVDAHARRFEETLKRLAHLPPGSRVLELGAVPYYMTVLLQRYLGLIVDTTSFYEVERAAVDVHEISNRSTGERFAFAHQPLNVERDVLPFADSTYDAVLCCEILEHLLINPSHMLYESHRVLKPNGWILVTTPNVARWQNVIAIAAGLNISDRYHGNGIYGRHNREWTLAEVVEVLTSCGFVVESAETSDVYTSLFATGQQPEGRGREDNIFVLGRSSVRRRLACPTSVYVLMDEYRNVLYPAIAMGINEVGHLGRGWLELEWDGERGCRWTGAAAQLSLRQRGQSMLELDVCAHHPDLSASPVEVALSVNGRMLGLCALTSYGWQTLSYAVPRDTRTLDVEISPSRTWCPASYGQADTRELGIRLSAARLR